MHCVDAVRHRLDARREGGAGSVAAAINYRHVLGGGASLQGNKTSL